MTRPTKFDLMRANRQPRSPEQRREWLQREIEKIEQAFENEWHQPRRPFAFEGVPHVVVREVDMDAVHAKRKNAVPRWWHGLNFNRRTT